MKKNNLFKKRLFALCNMFVILVCSYSFAGPFEKDLFNKDVEINSPEGQRLIVTEKGRLVIYALGVAYTNLFLRENATVTREKLSKELIQLSKDNKLLFNNNATDQCDDSVYQELLSIADELWETCFEKKGIKNPIISRIFALGQARAVCENRELLEKILTHRDPETVLKIFQNQAPFNHINPEIFYYALYALHETERKQNPLNHTHREIRQEYSSGFIYLHEYLSKNSAEYKESNNFLYLQKVYGYLHAFIKGVFEIFCYKKYGNTLTWEEFPNGDYSELCSLVSKGLGFTVNSEHIQSMIYASDRHSDNSDTQEHSFVKGKLFAYLYDHVSNLEDGDDITIWLAYKNAYETILLNKNGPSYFCEPFANCNKDVLINEFSSLLADALVFKC